MELSNTLIKEFAKSVITDNSKVPETMTYGTAVVSDGELYVKIDGSEILTPVTTTVSLSNGDRVRVTIRNHEAVIDGNTSDPSASSYTVDVIAAKIVNVNKLVADKADIKSLEAVQASVRDLEAYDLEIKGKLEANEASIKDLEAYDVEVKGKLEANEASIKDLEADKLSATDADLKYANIDFSNIGKAAMEYFYATSGLIKDVTVGDQTITGHLVGVTISGDLIEGNTIKAEKLVVKGEDGLYYKLNIEGGSTTTEEITEEDLQNGLDGRNIIAKTITAEQIKVNDLVAFDATIGGFNITDESLYSGVKSSIDNTTRGVYLDKTGQIAFGDSSNYLRYFLDEDGYWKLEIAAKTIKFGTGTKSIEEVVEEIQNDVEKTQNNLDNLEIGGRNLIRNSINMIFQNYYFYEPGESDPTELTVTWDDVGNVTVYGATATHDGEGNVTLIY